uniref:non-specific serine/threonine protein kinase n=1 Tax=Cyanothece sp. (strain PCC 7425 / ATCC 29141) TaxID=395961 RepID=B8HX91_CYAP4
MDPTELRGYRIIRPLGQGGFGKTFLVEDMHSATQQQYVIKQLHPQNADPANYAIAQERFQKEATVLLELSRKHRQIPRLYGYFFHDENFYLVQEYIEGMTLSEKVRREGPLSQAFLGETLIAILQILEVVHAENIIHRDIKPDNLIIRNSDQQPFLIDFGAVKECVSGVQGQMAGTSIIIGSPGFLAPEQADGHPVFASDLYSLGMTAIYLLTGKLPQQLPKDRRTYTPLWRSSAPEVSPRFAAVIDRAVQIFLDDRYSSAREMSQDLEAAIAHPSAPIPLEPTKVSYFQPSPSQPGSVQTPTEVAPTGNLSGANPIQRTSGLPTGLWWGLMGGVAIAVVAIGGFLLATNKTKEPVPESSPASPSPENSVPVIESPSLTPSPEPSSPSPEPSSPSPEPSSPSPEPSSPSPQPSTPAPTDTSQVNEGEAISLLEQLYFNLSNKNYAATQGAFSPQLADIFDPGFFNQFSRVTVENLTVTARTNNSISFIGENTYVYRDGSTQREERSYTVRTVDGRLVVTASEFIRVTKFR